MPTKPKFDPRKMMAKAIEVMKLSVVEPRGDKKASPLVGAVDAHFSHQVLATFLATMCRERVVRS
jgi:hypothetical protein